MNEKARSRSADETRCEATIHRPGGPPGGPPPPPSPFTPQRPSIPREGWGKLYEPGDGSSSSSIFFLTKKKQKKKGNAGNGFRNQLGTHKITSVEPAIHHPMNGNEWKVGRKFHRKCERRRTFFFCNLFIYLFSLDRFDGKRPCRCRHTSTSTLRLFFLLSSEMKRLDLFFCFK